MLTLVGVSQPVCECKCEPVDLRQRELRYWKHICGFTTYLMVGELHHILRAAATFVIDEYV